MTDRVDRRVHPRAAAAAQEAEDPAPVYPRTEWLDTTHAMRLYMHRKNLREGKAEGTAASKSQIRSFIDFYGINMDDFEPSDPDAYDTFEDFFVRAHKPGSRPIHAHNDPKSAVVVADSRVVVYQSVAASRKIWIKGLDFSITNLVMDTQLGAKFDDGAIASFRLSPQDYHRYHSPMSGKVKLFRSMHPTCFIRHRWPRALNEAETGVKLGVALSENHSET